MPLEGQEYLNVEFSDIIPGDCREGSDGHKRANTDGNGLPRCSLGRTHGGDIQAIHASR